MLFATIPHDAGAADYFDIRDFCQLGQDVVLHAVGEKGVRLVIAEILKRKDGDTFFRHDFVREAGNGLSLENVGSSQRADDQHGASQRAIGKSAALLLFCCVDDGDAFTDLLLQCCGGLRAFRGIHFEHALDEIDNGTRDSFQLIEWQNAAELLLANFFARTVERHLAG